MVFLITWLAGGVLGQGGILPPGENPDTADTQDVLAPAWDSVSLSTSLHNAEPEDPQPREATRRLSVTGSLRILDANRALALSRYSSGAAVALDELGNIWETDSSMPMLSHYSRPRVDPFTGQLRPEHFSLNFPMNPDLGYPTELKELAWSVPVLTAKEIILKTIAFEVSTDWIELFEGTRIWVDEAVSEGTTYRYVMRAEFDGENPFNMGSSIRVRGALPSTIVLDTEMLDAKGLSVIEQSRGYSRGSSMSGSTHSATMKGDASCDKCGGVKTIQFTLARELEEIQIPVELFNIPVPTF